MTTTRITPAELAETMKAEIIKDCKRGVIPPSVRSFAELHDYVDANCYGNTEGLFEDAHLTLDEICDLCNPAQDIVHVWLAAGGLKDIKIDPSLFRVIYDDGTSYVTCMVPGTSLEQAMEKFLGDSIEVKRGRGHLTMRVVRVEWA